MSNDVINHTGLLEDKNKLHLTKDDFFDRIINVKIYTVKSDGSYEVFVIRSDWEAVFLHQTIHSVLSRGNWADDEYTIRRCVYKPSINFSYKRVSGNTATTLDLYLSNFFVFSADGKVLASFNADNYKIARVEILMGYWGQFKDYPHASVNDLFDFTPRYGADKIVMGSAEYVTTEGLPPDYKLHIHGYVANILSSPEDTYKPKTYNEAVNTDSIIKATGEEGDLAKVFKALITDRFIDSDGNGIKVILSEGANALKLDMTIDAEGNWVYQEIFAVYGESVNNAVFRAIENVAPHAGLNFKPMNDGSIFVFLLSEAENMENLEAPEDNVWKNVYNNRLPAVYNVNIDETAHIICPFFAFIDPFQEVEFEYRYNVSSLVTFYASTSTGRTVFKVINMLVSFATVDNVNEVQLYCVTK